MASISGINGVLDFKGFSLAVINFNSRYSLN